MKDILAVVILGILITLVCCYDRDIILNNSFVGKCEKSIRRPGLCYYSIEGREPSVVGTMVGFYDSCGKHPYGEAIIIK